MACTCVYNKLTALEMHIGFVDEYFFVLTALMCTLRIYYNTIYHDCIPVTAWIQLSLPSIVVAMVTLCKVGLDNRMDVGGVDIR